MPQYTTTASEAPCRHCRRPLIYAWDEGLLVRVDALALDAVVAAALRDAGRRVYAYTEGRHLVHETAQRAGTLRLVRSRHAEHRCAKRPAVPAPAEQVALFEIDPPPQRRPGGR